MKAWFKERWRNSKFFQGMVVGAILSVIPGIIQVGYAAYIAYYPYALTIQRNPVFVELFDPAPKLDAPWPPIAPPTEPLPRLSAADIDTYFFPAEALEPENGLAIWRFEKSSLALSSSVQVARKDEEILAFYESFSWKIEGLPPGYLLYAPGGRKTREGPVEEIRVYPARKVIKEESRWRSLWSSSGPIGERMEELGCTARPILPRRRFDDDGSFTVPPGDYRLSEARIATWHRLDEPTVDHCLFKALLVALGLHPTEGFFFKEGPVTPAEQARALAALQLVYHPAVKPGMTKEEFVGTLLAEGLIDP